MSDTGLFHRVEDAFVITSEKGLHRQAELYERRDVLYARHGQGFARLIAGELTTVPSLRWKEIVGVNTKVDAVRGVIFVPAIETTKRAAA